MKEKMMAGTPHWNHDTTLHAWWADDNGCVLAGEFPSHHANPTKTREKLSLLATAGIGTIIDLTEDHEGLTPYADLLAEVAAEHGVTIERISHPIPDVNVTTAEHYDKIVGDIERAVANGRKVYIHCWGGVGRTSTVVGCWHVCRGLTPDEALGRIKAARAGTKKANRRAPETDRQDEAIREAHARRATQQGDERGA
jgi:protein-tyrosine phosphatase